MDEVDRFYLEAVGGYSALRKGGAEALAVAVYISRAFHDRIAPHLAKHPAAGMIAPGDGVTAPNKIAGLPIHVVEGQAEDFIVRT